MPTPDELQLQSLRLNLAYARDQGEAVEMARQTVQNLSDGMLVTLTPVALEPWLRHGSRSLSKQLRLCGLQSEAWLAHLNRDFMAWSLRQTWDPAPNARRFELISGMDEVARILERALPSLPEAVSPSSHSQRQQFELKFQERVFREGAVTVCLLKVHSYGVYGSLLGPARAEAIMQDVALWLQNDAKDCDQVRYGEDCFAILDIGSGRGLLERFHQRFSKRPVPAGASVGASVAIRDRVAILEALESARKEVENQRPTVGDVTLKLAGGEGGDGPWTLSFRGRRPPGPTLRTAEPWPEG